MSAAAMIEGASDAAIAEWLAARLAVAMAARPGPVTITAPGGSTPFPILVELARHDLDWARLVVWPTDDRAVPEDHPASNTGRLRAALAPLGAEVVTLSVMEQVPAFELAWIGMGTDGHVASLFPSADPRLDCPDAIVRLTPNPLPPDAPFDRISLTLPSLLDSGAIVFVIRGDDKRRVFDRALTGQSDLPVARLLSAAKQPVTCFT